MIKSQHNKGPMFDDKCKCIASECNMVPGKFEYRGGNNFINFTSRHLAIFARLS